MIPKKIHYCWFGRGEKPKLVKKCMESWKKYCPEYELAEWNEDTFDIHKNAYTQWCYENRKYAFLSDYVRLLVVEEHGGIYLDTDVELLRPLDGLLENEAFFGFETDAYVNTGIGFGAQAHNPVMQKMVAEYDPLLDGKHGTVGCPHLNTAALLEFGLQQNGKMQKLGVATVYPSSYFNPYDAPTGRLRKTEDTYSIHWYSALWLSKAKRIRMVIGRPLHRLLGTDFLKNRS